MANSPDGAEQAVEHLPNLVPNTSEQPTATGPTSDGPDLHRDSPSEGVSFQGRNVSVTRLQDDHSMISPYQAGFLPNANDESPTTAVNSQSVSSSPISTTIWTSNDPLFDNGKKDPTIRTEPSEPPPVDWKPSLLRIGPLVGLFAICFAVLQIIASYAVLKTSHHDAVANWKYQPTVYLAILTAISNKALAFAVVQGTVITWWLKAVRGTTLNAMHQDWANGLFLYKAVASGRKFNALALACICANLVAMDGPLLQRASSVKLEVPQNPVPLSISIMPELPSYFSGWAVYASLPSIIGDFSPDFLPVLRDYESGTPIRGIAGCSGTCSVIVRAPVLAVDHCFTSIAYRNYSTPLSVQEAKIFNTSHVLPADRRLFGIVAWVEDGTTEHLALQTLLPDQAATDTCAGNVNKTTCYLVSAIGEYNVSVTDGVVKFHEPPSYPKIISRANNTAITPDTIERFGLRYAEGSTYIRSTLAGLSMTMNWQFSQQLSLAPALVPGDTPAMINTQASPQWIPLQYITNYKAWDNTVACAPAFRDPRDDMMAALNELMFRTGVFAAQSSNSSFLQMDAGLTAYYSTMGKALSPINVFESDFAYFAGAAAVEGSCILAILFTFYGWWHLGRSCTFSPLELAKVTFHLTWIQNISPPLTCSTQAFDAPLLRGVRANQNGRRVARDGGFREVQYGMLANPEKLTVGDKASIHDINESPSSAKEWYDRVKSMVV